MERNETVYIYIYILLITAIHQGRRYFEIIANAIAKIILQFRKKFVF